MAKEYWKGGNMINPLPVVMVSSKRKNEKPNIITVAWAGTVCTNPPMVSISIKPSRYSYDIIKESKEFVINLVTKDICKVTDFCGVKSGRDIDKFKETGLTPFSSKYVECPSIDESPVNIECHVERIIDLGSHSMFVARVLGVTIENENLSKSNKLDLNKLGLVTYSHGEYCLVGEKIGKFGFAVQKRKGKHHKK